MKNNKFFKKIIILSIILISTLPIVSLAQRTKSSLSVGEQRHAEKGLKDNRYFFYFINSSITNLGTEEEKKIFKEAIQRDIIAQLLYMKFLFHDSFVEIRHVQKLLVSLYKITLKRDVDTTMKLLNGFAPIVIQTNQYKARHYLKLGYRDTVHAKTDMIMGDNYRESLYSMRLYKYAMAIKKVKHGKRYAFYSILEQNTPIDKKKVWGLLKYDELKEKISKISEEKKDYYLKIHQDNFYKFKDDKSFFDKIWEKPTLNEIPEYKKYLEKE